MQKRKQRLVLVVLPLIYSCSNFNTSDSAISSAGIVSDAKDNDDLDVRSDSDLLSSSDLCISEYDNKYRFKKTISVKAPESSNIPEAYTLKIKIDHKAMVSDDGALENGTDLALVHYDTACNASLVNASFFPETGLAMQNSQLWFSSHEAVSSNEISHAYTLYYGLRSDFQADAENVLVSFDSLVDYYSSFEEATNPPLFNPLNQTTNAVYDGGVLKLEGTNPVNDPNRLHGVTWAGAERLPPGSGIDTSFEVNQLGSPAGQRILPGLYPSLLFLYQQSAQRFNRIEERGDGPEYSVVKDAAIPQQFGTLNFTMNLQPDLVSLKIDEDIPIELASNNQNFLPLLAFSPGVADVPFLASYHYVVIRKIIKDDGNIRVTAGETVATGS